MCNRMPSQKLAVLALPLALLLNLLPVSASADPSSQGGRVQGQAGHAASHSPDERHQQMMKELGLSPEQGQKVKSAMEQGRAQSQPLREQLKTKRKAMMQYLQTPNATEAGARTLNSDINDLQRRLSEIRLKTWFSIRSQLNPEQLQKLQALKAKHWAQRSNAGGRSHSPEDY
ncbi:Spy/CpxP family protein refolding chaperone [Vampirovibrio chlorellavorus]|uniref:Spy/CpxP family protein refolding chaperone n=1 Tax=Vampirovibrio chlorellavorus TaxID=758823 RepID=UPI0026F3235C|nr:Spy/CpxP family protein refolding chaperone [Vampirovibrio chlorellavorus]